MKILIVDDKEENLYLLESLLEGYGYEVTSAMNGVEALEVLKADSFDLIISDILMPTMDGFQLCRECKRDDELSTIPFIFYSATYIDRKDQEFALSLGAERFIVKPIEPARFIEIIVAALKNHERGLISPRKVPAQAEEADFLTVYNQRLIKKLEDKLFELEEVNKALRESEQRHRSLLEASPDPIVVYDMAGNVTYINPAFGDTFGWSLDELNDQEVDFVPEGCLAESDLAIISALQSEEANLFETRRLTKDGRVLDIQLS